MDALGAMKFLSIQGDKEFTAHLMRSISARIGGVKTDFVFAEYENKTLVVISQYDKLGCMLLIEREKANSGTEAESSVFSVRLIFGNMAEEAQVAGRFIAEQINITKPLNLFMALKSYDIDTVRACKDVILDLKTESQMEE